MSKAAVNLQDITLNQLRKERTMVTIYLKNGFQFRGFVRGFDTFVVVIESEGKQHMLYKHAISTICPLRPVSLPVAPDENDDEEEPS